MNKRQYIALACLLAFAANAGAQTEYADSVQMEEFVVTGTRTLKVLAETPIQTRLISAKDIKESDATNISDLLQQEIPGIEFSYSMSQQVNMNMAGFSGQGVLFLIDGERLAGETMDNTDFQRIDMSNVERIEIVKGAASALYGSSANGGVINIITKDKQKSLFKINANARIAAHNEQRYGAGIGISKGIATNTLSIQHTRIDTYDVHSAEGGLSSNIVSSVYGGRTWNFKDHLVLKPCDGLKITARAGYFFRERLFNPLLPDRYRDYSAGLRAKYRISENDDIEVSYSFDQYDKSDFQKLAKLDIRDYSNVQNIVRGLYNHSFGTCNTLTAGGEFMRDYLSSYQFDDGAKVQKSANVFVQDDWEINRQWEIIGAVRFDYFSNGKTSRATTKLGICYKPSSRQTFRVSYGEGFRTPTLKERFMNFDMLGTGSIYIRGNKDLRPETSHNFNASAEFYLSHYTLSVTGFYNKVSNRITTSSPQTDAESNQQYMKYMNISNLSIYGGELTAQAQWACGLGAKLSYAYSREESKGTSLTPYLPARPHSATFKLNYTRKFCKKYDFTATLSGRYLSALNNKELDITSYVVYDIEYPAYSLWKISLSQQFAKGISLNLALDNLLGYKPKYYYYNAPLTTGRNLMAGMSWNL